ncbi:hypothetical protein [Streptosporangium carneum]|uniref:hypothetical protein n=1 Tax=Streptosporangium carneum TaxID=47481 RepID=UPI0022F2CE16|nr:hypothetical protein [Streptosporangium carneum]
MAGLYLVIVAVAAVVSVVTGDIGYVWTAVAWLPLSGRILNVFGGTFAVLPVVVAELAVLAVLKAWMLWQVFTLPPRGKGPAGRRAVRLRRLLYLAVADSLFLSVLTGRLPDVLDEALRGALWGALKVLFVLAVVWGSRRLRTLALLCAWGDLTAMAMVAADEIPGVRLPSALMLLGLVAFVWQAVILVGQRRDGRWSSATVRIGWFSVVASMVIRLAVMLVGLVSLPLSPAVLWLLGELNVFFTVWIARSAHELTDPGGQVVLAAGGRPSRLLRTASATVVLVPLLGMIQPEVTPRLTYTGWEDECLEWTDLHRRYGDTRPQDREKAFLCHARAEAGRIPPMFPDTLSDQQILAYGRLMCAAPDGREQGALLKRAGSARSAWGVDQDALVFLCPDTVAVRSPELLSSEVEEQAENARYVAETNARCFDPWPGLRARRQRTAAYFLFEGGGYGLHDFGDPTEDDAFDVALDDGFVGVSGSSAVVMTYRENEPICLTVKAFGSAPPLRLKGWDQVAEVGIVSRSGRLGVPVYSEGRGSGAGARLPNLALKGPGRYRLRVYAREDEGRDLGEEHLVVVFPGGSARKTVYRPLPR